MPGLSRIATTNQFCRCWPRSGVYPSIVDHLNLAVLGLCQNSVRPIRWKSTVPCPTQTHPTAKFSMFTVAAKVQSAPVFGRQYVTSHHSAARPSQCAKQRKKIGAQTCRNLNRVQPDSIDTNSIDSVDPGLRAGNQTDEFTIGFEFGQLAGQLFHGIDVMH